MERTNFEKLRVYKLAETLADGIWGVVITPKLNAYFRSVNTAALANRKQSTKHKVQSPKA
jgi:hypothetical protein